MPRELTTDAADALDEVDLAQLREAHCAIGSFQESLDDLIRCLAPIRVRVAADAGELSAKLMRFANIVRRGEGVWGVAETIAAIVEGAGEGVRR